MREVVLTLIIEEMGKDGLAIKLENTSSSVLYPVMGIWKPLERHPAFEIPPQEELELYVHIPTCAYKCGFCQYNTVTNMPESQKQEFVDLLLKEQKLLNETPLLRDSTITGIYFGGGTPTELNSDLLKRLVNELMENINHFYPKEVTIEVSPDSIVHKDGRKKLEICKEAGVDRLSFGVQTFNDSILRDQKRGHSEKDAEETARIAFEYFDHVNIDLIYGFPGQTLEIWENDLSKAVESKASSITLYDLRIYPKDRYHINPYLLKLFSGNSSKFPDEERRLLMRIMGELFLCQNGYEQKINNWFTKGVSHKAQYNRWKTKEKNNNILRVSRDGFGSSTYKDHEEFVYSNYLWPEWREHLKRGDLPHNAGMEVTSDERLRRDIIYGIKITEGIDISLLTKKYGTNPLDYFKKEIEILRKHNIIEADNSSLRLSRAGRYVAETAAKAFYSNECKRAMGF